VDLGRSGAIERWNTRPVEADTAAPDLLEALKNLLEACYCADEDGELSDRVDGSLLDAAKDAIAKAEATP